MPGIPKSVHSVVLVLIGTVVLPLAAQSVIPGASTANDPDVVGAERLFSAWMEGQIAYRGLPGIAVGVVSDQDLAWSKGFGFADIKARIPITATTKFRIASNSKLFTAIAIMPWGAYDSDGILRIGLFDRQYDSVNELYGYSLATETGLGTLAFISSELTTARSDPTNNNLWFAATINPDFPFATTFLGDYSNIAAVPSGGIVAYWTDLRQEACFGGTCGHGQDAFFAAAH